MPCLKAAFTLRICEVPSTATVLSQNYQTGCHTTEHSDTQHNDIQHQGLNLQHSACLTRS
jgi:hypothetical protein